MILRCFAVAAALLVLLANTEAERILSDQATSALWTVGPGQELYTAFGHSALRITDPVIGFDRLYNFGTFDFSTPNFYLKFIQGDLDYFLTCAIALEVIQEYRANHQLVIEQQLNLNPAELDELFLAMEANLQPENSAYRYDFVRDNCTTRIRDAVAKVAKVQWQPLEKNSPTLRQMIQPYVEDRPAIKSGINLLFGANMDHSATANEAMFLPEDMKIAFDKATVYDETGGRQLVSGTQILLDGPKLPTPGINWFVITTYFVATVAFMTAAKGKLWPRWLDIVLFCTTALVGCFIWFLWLGTRHWVLHENWNLLWAWPTHLIIWFFPKRVQRGYWLFYACFILLSDLALGFHSAGVLTVQDHFSFLGIKLILAFRALALRRRSLQIVSTA